MKYALINKLKLNKVAGSDNIPPELLKHGGRTLKRIMQINPNAME